MKQRLVESNALRVNKIETGEQVVGGVNRWTETEPSPLAGEGAFRQLQQVIRARLLRPSLHRDPHARSAGKAMAAARDGSR